MDADLAARLLEVDASIADAARAAGRDPAALTRIVITKFHPTSLVRELYGLGVRDVGENRQQEFTEKAAQLTDLDGLRWHFVGQLQTKKARAVRQAASAVHSLDRERLADALDRAGTEGEPPLDVLIQVNLTDDPGRGGVEPSGIEGLAEHVAGCSTLRLRGIMSVAPLGEPAAPAFERLAGYAERLRTVVPDADWMSAGMSADFAAAIAAGATHLRIGSAITGPRPERR
ncbi:YggS family pyridoxal phosphate-dependent enzyme [Microbacterium thalassium]|uniref:Pyridoxal phosphate homeostasis protein n=1 Tax=Microbacterium thalassium TaxID=362649 RepID=A0A7X0FQI3_9MICO|nr:YggS family pyridoxal phosphate-dependent enzyme [Microbacterium thalassium]MBB6391679.1 pyridoxal phosphate enzyme (YggS family) [Microbacterium thalassium]GLK24282.1 YggS family pyridoxal phosphate enzyme [Microbacterium thalassium]